MITLRKCNLCQCDVVPGNGCEYCSTGVQNFTSKNTPLLLTNDPTPMCEPCVPVKKINISSGEDAFHGEFA